ncbi:hypothetical protein RCL_jg25190.t1 [Rhizophagus clarus]|uniref:Endonuclease/exonuclease/phosphatase domain-containing protein n=1 Tax=Rhizophagus clarus TaxID=94130 RepID=A0A8H3LRK9_9GLOM|nr:hypothetical protein RCL_jg25190.t1 [Rhizophagus clarus]
MTVHFNNYRITGSPRDYNINWSARNKKLAKIPTIRPSPLDKLVSITHQEDSHHIEIRQEEHHKFSHNPHKHNLKNKQRFSSKPTNPKLLNKRTPHFTGANTVALGKRINSAIITNLPSMDISDTSDTSSSSNSLTNHKNGIIEGSESGLIGSTRQQHDLTYFPSLNREIDTFLHRARIILNNNNLDYMDHSINFINLKIGFHNINELASDPDKLRFLLEWYHANNFDFMGIAETNSNCVNLQHFIKDTYDDCSYDLAGSPKSITKPKGSGVALLIHSKWRKFHFDTKIFSPFLMVSKFGTKHRQLWIWVYYLSPTDKLTLRTFEQIMNNTTSDSHIIHIWMGDTNRHFNHRLDVYPSTSDKKEDIPLCFHHLNLIDSFRFLNPEAKKFSWHRRSQDDALRIDICIDHIWIQRHITPSLRFAHHYDGYVVPQM